MKEPGERKRGRQASFVEGGLDSVCGVLGGVTAAAEWAVDLLYLGVLEELVEDVGAKGTSGAGEDLRIVVSLALIRN